MNTSVHNEERHHQQRAIIQKTNRCQDKVFMAINKKLSLKVFLSGWEKWWYLMLLCLIGKKKKAPLIDRKCRESASAASSTSRRYHKAVAVTSLFMFMQLSFTRSPWSSSSVEFIVRVPGMGACLSPPSLKSGRSKQTIVLTQGVFVVWILNEFRRLQSYRCNTTILPVLLNLAGT